MTPVRFAQGLEGKDRVLQVSVSPKDNLDRTVRVCKESASLFSNTLKIYAQCLFRGL